MFQKLASEQLPVATEPPEGPLTSPETTEQPAASAPSPSASKLISKNKGLSYWVPSEGSKKGLDYNIRGKYKRQARDLMAALEKSSIVSWSDDGNVSLWDKKTHLYISAIIPLTFYSINYPRALDDEIRLWFIALMDEGCNDFIKNKQLIMSMSWWYLGR